MGQGSGLYSTRGSVRNPRKETTRAWIKGWYPRVTHMSSALTCTPFFGKEFKAETWLASSCLSERLAGLLKEALTAAGLCLAGGREWTHSRQVWLSSKLQVTCHIAVLYTEGISPCQLRQREQHREQPSSMWQRTLCVAPRMCPPLSAAPRICEGN